KRYCVFDLGAGNSAPAPAHVGAHFETIEVRYVFPYDSLFCGPTSVRFCAVPPANSNLHQLDILQFLRSVRHKPLGYRRWLVSSTERRQHRWVRTLFERYHEEVHGPERRSTP